MNGPSNTNDPDKSPPDRQVLKSYQDPLELIWLHLADQLHIRIQRSDEVFASWDGRGTLSIGNDPTLDADDCLAQIVFHELCHFLTQGPQAWTTPDWNLSNDDPDDIVNELACVRLQAAIADTFGLRHLLAVTTDFRAYFDELPPDPLAGHDPATQLAKTAWKTYENWEYRPALDACLQRTRQILELVADIAPPNSLWQSSDKTRPKKNDLLPAHPAHPAHQTDPLHSNWTTSDGVTIEAEFHAAADCQAGLLLNHGWGDHQGRYAWLIEQLNQQGISILTHDLRGHGRSGGKRGYSPSYDILLDDLAIALEQAAARMNNTPLLLWGHSFGGLLTLDFLLRHANSLSPQQDVAAAIITSPLLKLNMKVPTWKQLLARFAAVFLPKVTMPAGIDLAGLSRDSTVENNLRKDPLRQGKMSSRVYLGLTAAARQVLTADTPLPCPVLIMHGEADPITAPQASQQFALAHANCHYQPWPNSYHELHNEINRQVILHFVQNWLSKHTTTD